MTNQTIENIELGAGCGNFGKIFYNPCIQTDNDININSYCKNAKIDKYCDAENTPFEPNQFKLVIMCNPYYYGFLDKDQAILLMTEIIRILKLHGKILVITNERNIYANLDAISFRIPEFENILRVKLKLTSKPYDPTDYPNHKFFCCKNSRETKPNQFIEIELSEHSI
jgi:SAM-dependent methyltransferase